MRTTCFTSSSLAMLFAAAPAFGDAKIASKYTSEGQPAETITMYAQGEHMRYEYSGGVVLLRDCAQRRIVQLDTKNHSYVSVPAAAEAAKGVVESKATDTGEQKELFGHPAHHWKLVQPSEEGKGRTETDGWYIDGKQMPSCVLPGAATLGYPVSYTITTYKDGAKEASKVSMEVTEFSGAPLEASLFAVPADYKETGKEEAPPPGKVRVGAVVPHGVNPQAYDRMVGILKQGNLGVVMLAEAPPEEIQTKARDTNCDYVLYTELKTIDRPATNKIGGLLRKTPMVKSVTGDSMEAQVSFRLVPAAGGEPALASSVTGKAGTSFDWKAAVNLASTFTPMMMMARMMGAAGALNPSMLNALTSGSGYGKTMAGMDPMMGGLNLFLQSASLVHGGAPGNPNHAAGDGAIIAALELEAKAVAEKLKQ